KARAAAKALAQESEATAKAPPSDNEDGAPGKATAKATAFGEARNPQRIHRNDFTAEAQGARRKPGAGETSFAWLRIFDRRYFLRASASWRQEKSFPKSLASG